MHVCTVYWDLIISHLSWSAIHTALFSTDINISMSMWKMVYHKPGAEMYKVMSSFVSLDSNNI